MSNVPSDLKCGNRPPSPVLVLQAYASTRGAVVTVCSRTCAARHFKKNETFRGTVRFVSRGWIEIDLWKESEKKALVLERSCDVHYTTESFFEIGHVYSTLSHSARRSGMASSYVLRDIPNQTRLMCHHATSGSTTVEHRIQRTVQNKL